MPKDKKPTTADKDQPKGHYSDLTDAGRSRAKQPDAAPAAPKHDEQAPAEAPEPVDAEAAYQSRHAEIEKLLADPTLKDAEERSRLAHELIEMERQRAKDADHSKQFHFDQFGRPMRQ